MKNTPLASNLKFIVVDFDYGIPPEISLLAMKGIAKLITYTPGVADCLVYIAVRMTVNPIVNTAVRDEIAKFRGKSTIDGTTFELISHQFKRRHMVSCHDDMLGAACRHASFDELAASFMLLIETLCREPELVTVQRTR